MYAVYTGRDSVIFPEWKFLHRQDLRVQCGKPCCAKQFDHVDDDGEYDDAGQLPPLDTLPTRSRERVYRVRVCSIRESIGKLLS